MAWTPGASFVCHWGFVILSSLGISSFVIRPRSRLYPNNVARCATLESWSPLVDNGTMAHPVSVIVSQSSGRDPHRRSVEEELVARLLMEGGMDVNLISDLADLETNGTGQLCLEGIFGPMIVVSWMKPREAYETLRSRGIEGSWGRSQPISDEEPPVEAVARRRVYCVDMSAESDPALILAEIRRCRDEAPRQTVPSTGSKLAHPLPVVTRPMTVLPNGDVSKAKGRENDHGDGAAEPKPRLAEDDEILDSLMDELDDLDL